jgi:hypothetical protein
VGSSVSPFSGGWGTALAPTVASFGFLWSLVLFLAALMLYLTPQRHRSIGWTILIASGAGLLTDLGGFFIGAILSASGGILALGWRMPPEPAIADEFEGSATASKS